MPLAIVLAVSVSILVGLLLETLAVEPARNAPVVTLIIITIGASILLRGLATLVWDKKIHSLPAFSGEAPIAIRTPMSALTCEAASEIAGVRIASVTSRPSSSTRSPSTIVAASASAAASPSRSDTSSATQRYIAPLSR